MHRNKYLFLTVVALVWVSSVGCTGILAEKEDDKKQILEEEKYEQILMTEAKQLMETETDYIILDVRAHDEFDEGHLPGAICIPNETIGGAEIKELPDKGQLILVYCRSGNRSKQASAKLVELGYTNVKEFGGIKDWDGDIEK